METSQPLNRNRDYLLLWGGQVVSTFGSMSTSVVYPLLVLSMTGSPAAAGVILALRALPYLVFSLPAGALIDRWNRKRVMIFCDLGRALAIATIPLALWLHALTVAQLCGVALMEGTLFVFFNLAEVAALPRLVPTHQLPQATAQNEASFGIASVAAPSIGTALFQSLGAVAPFVADVVSYGVSAAALLTIRKPFHAENKPPFLGLRRDIAEGLAWLWKNRLVRTMAFLVGGMNIVGGAMPLVLIVLAKESGATALEIGVIFSIGGLGGVIGSLIGGRVQRRFSFGQVVLAVLWANVLLLPFYLLSKHVFAIGLIFALVALTSPIFNVVQFSYRLSLIPDGLQGRVNSVFRLIAFGFDPLAAVAVGFLLERRGSTTTILFLTAWFLFLALAATLNRTIRSAPRLPRT